MTPQTPPTRVAIVGPCAAGKSTLAAALRLRHLVVKEVVQEHSFVPDLWRVFFRPDFLIYLDAGVETANRRKRLDLRPADHAEQVARLAHARRHCHLYLATDDLTPEEVLSRVLRALGRAEQAGV